MERYTDTDAPVIKLVHFLIEDAHKKRASDVHIEPLEDRLRLRYRIDGVLHEFDGPSKRLQGAIISRIKIMAGMDIAEKRLPQDGRIKFDIDGRKIDIRVSSLPALHGESIVLRLLDKGRFLMDLGELGFFEEEQNRFIRLVHTPYGMILVTGPTGSGKTTTLYACLMQLNQRERKIITVEDPVEYEILGINQVNVRSHIGLNFAGVLRSMLRQAPDIIMVGEIRDRETAEISVQAALTGHLVFSTLHTNDAVSSVIRLIDMGVKSYLVASTVQGVLAQRLIRRICKNCQVEYKPASSVIKSLGIDRLGTKHKFYKGKGCADCSNTGYKGRIGVYELFVLNETTRQLIFQRASVETIRREAIKNGMISLRQDGIRKVIKGLTTLEEVLRVTHR